MRNYSMYRVEECELIFEVPQIQVGEPMIKVGISAAGGGTVGREYGNNRWSYVIEDAAGVVQVEGDDIRSGMPAGHLQMIGALLDSLGSYAEGKLVPDCQSGSQRERICVCDPATGDTDPECWALVSQGDVVARGSTASFIHRWGERFSVAGTAIDTAEGRDTDHEHTAAELSTFIARHVIVNQDDDE